MGFGEWKMDVEMEWRRYLKSKLYYMVGNEKGKKCFLMT